MARLREFYWNGGNMLDLIRYQKSYKMHDKEVIEYYIPKKFNNRPYNSSSEIAAKYADTYITNSGPGRKSLDMFQKINLEPNY